MLEYLKYLKERLVELNDQFQKEIDAQERIDKALKQGAKYYVCWDMPTNIISGPFDSPKESKEYILKNNLFYSYIENDLNIYLYLNNTRLDITEPNIAYTEKAIKYIKEKIKAEEALMAEIAEKSNFRPVQEPKPALVFKNDFEKMEYLFKTKNNTTFAVGINKKCEITRAFSANFALIRLPNGKTAGVRESAYSGGNDRHVLTELKEIFVKRIKFNEKGQLEVCNWTL